jgi:hypothetical protein
MPKGVKYFAVCSAVLSCVLQPAWDSPVGGVSCETCELVKFSVFGEPVIELSCSVEYLWVIKTHHE